MITSSELTPALFIPLSQMSKPSVKASYKPISKEKARLALLKAGPEEIERLYNLEIKNQIENNEREENERYFNQPSYAADLIIGGDHPIGVVSLLLFT